MVHRKTKDMTRAELELRELFELADRLEAKLSKLEDMAGHALILAQMSHSLIVIRKIGEDKLENVNALLD